MGKFIWTVAHNTLSNYYRDTAKSMVGVSIDEVAELIADPYSELDTDDNRDAMSYSLYSTLTDGSCYTASPRS